MIAVGVLAYCVLILPLLSADPWRLASLQLRNEGMVLFLFMVQGLARGRLVQASSAGMWTVFIWALACLLLVLALVPSIRLPGVFLICGGLASNVFVSLVNGGMPYLYSVKAELVQDGPFYAPVLGPTHFAWLGDVLPDPSAGWLLSLGDLLLGVGAVVLVISVAIDGAIKGQSSKGLT